jgi:pseudaminic acid synthase
MIENKKTYIIAEVSANHAHSFKKAVKLIEEAKKAGADAVKFQTYSADTMTIDVNNKYFKIKHPRWGGQTLYQLYKKVYTPWTWFRKLKKIAEDLEIDFFSTAFDKSSVDFLEDLNVPMHKIASFELVDLPLIKYVAKTKKPLILSTGMASLKEIKEAVDTARGSGVKKIYLLKCISSYPASPEEMNLKTIVDLKKRFHLPVGISDHSLGIGVSVSAVALGAELVEKHFMASKREETVDSFFSIDPIGFKSLVENIRLSEKAVGSIKYGLSKEERKNMFFRRSLFVVKDIDKGELISYENVRSIRPSCGIEPKNIDKVINLKAKKYLKRGTPLKWEFLTK